MLCCHSIFRYSRYGGPSVCGGEGRLNESRCCVLCLVFVPCLHLLTVPPVERQLRRKHAWRKPSSGVPTPRTPKRKKKKNSPSFHSYKQAPHSKAPKPLDIPALTQRVLQGRFGGELFLCLHQYFPHGHEAVRGAARLERPRRRGEGQHGRQCAMMETTDKKERHHLFAKQAR